MHNRQAASSATEDHFGSNVCAHNIYRHDGGIALLRPSSHVAEAGDRDAGQTSLGMAVRSMPATTQRIQGMQLCSLQAQLISLYAVQYVCWGLLFGYDELRMLAGDLLIEGAPAPSLAKSQSRSRLSSAQSADEEDQEAGGLLTDEQLARMHQGRTSMLTPQTPPDKRQLDTAGTVLNVIYCLPSVGF